MGIDLSPIIALLIIIFLQVALVQSLKDLSIRMH
jgi:YggT family protein